MKGLEEYLKADESYVSLTPIRTLNIDGHEVAWMEYEVPIMLDLSGRGREGQIVKGRCLYCECDFTFEKLDDGSIIRRSQHPTCRYKKAAVALRELELREEYNDRSGGLVHGGAILFQRDLAKEFTVDIINRSQNGEWVGSLEQPLYLQTVARILNIYDSEMWKLIAEMDAEHLLNRNAAILSPYSPHPEYGGDPSDEFGVTEDKGLRIVAYAPRNRYERREWLIKVYRGEEILRLATAEMFHEPLFGFDVEDVEALETRVQELIDELGQE